MDTEKKMHRPLSQAQAELYGKMVSEVKGSGLKTVCFKLDEVLTVIPFAENSDFFSLMEKDFAAVSKSGKSFAQLRIAAQQAAESKLSLNNCVTIDKIYDILMKNSDLSAESCLKLMELECELVKQMTIPRSFGKMLFDEAKRKKRRVLLVYTGIYLRKTVEEIIGKCGYGENNGLIIPSETNIPDSASTGYIKLTAEKAKCSESQILYIGSDVTVDVEAPIMRGSKALLMQSETALMIKSGRLRGCVQAKYMYDYETEKLFTLRCVFGLYRLYGFDVPQNKTVQSDFCGDAYMMGFMVLGALSLIKDFKPQTDMQEKLISSLEKCSAAVEGAGDFRDMYSAYFGKLSEKLGTEGCELPLYFLENYAFNTDRELLKPYLSDEDFEKWSKCIKEPDIAHVYAHAPKKNAAAKLADKLFPPGTKVRNIVDGILSKGRKF